MDLSVEAIAMEARWQGLFTPEEIDHAASMLSRYGFNPPLEASAKTADPEATVAKQLPSFGPIRLGGSVLAAAGRSLTPFGLLSECEATSRRAEALSQGLGPAAHPTLRRHIASCLACRAQFPEMEDALARFDEDALRTWADLLKVFQASLELEDEKLQRFLVGPDYTLENAEPDEDDWEREMYLDQIREVCAWRAIRLGSQVGQFMAALAGTFAGGSGIWLKWRSGEIPGAISEVVRGLDQELFFLCLVAKSLVAIRSWPREEEGILWVPSDGDLTSVPGLVQVDVFDGFEEWVEYLSPPPAELNVLGTLFVAQMAAVAELEKIEPSRTEHTGIGISPDQFEESIRRAVSDARAEEREQSNAIIRQLESIVACMRAPDRHECDAALRAELPGVYEKLDPRVRSICLGAEQMYRVSGFAAPGLMIHAIATAFEVQLCHTIVPALYHHLKERGVNQLLPLPEWQDVDRKKPIWHKNTKAEKCTLGTIELILRHSDSRIEDFFAQFGVRQKNSWVDSGSGNLPSE